MLDAWLGPGLASGTRSGTVGDERVDERWRDGKLVERRFTRLAAVASAPRGDVTITYSGDGPEGLATLVTLENQQFGYTLTVESFPAR